MWMQYLNYIFNFQKNCNGKYSLCYLFVFTLEEKNICYLRVLHSEIVMPGRFALAYKTKYQGSECVFTGAKLFAPGLIKHFEYF